MSYNPIVLALDVKSEDQVRQTLDVLAPHLGMVKVGLELFINQGPSIIKLIQEVYQLPVFLDLKLFDIPNTVSKAVSSVVDLGVSIITVHAIGGTAMVKAALQSAQNTSTKVAIVSTLTSEPNANFYLPKLAADLGADTFICGGPDLKMIRNLLGPKTTLLVPGVRPVILTHDDQQRTMTPVAAMKAGADYLVVGRPILTAENPLSALQEILSSIHH